MTDLIPTVTTTTDGSKKSRKHNYTSELELKSLLIRIKNDRLGRGVCEFNSRINKYVALYERVNSKKYEAPAKSNLVKARIKQRVISDSEKTRVDRGSYERFGEIVLLMIKNILRKPQFSGYTYGDDFYSDAVYKITKYLHNFDHTKISKVSGQPVNAFAYISQYIHNSVIGIIKKKKKESARMKSMINIENLNHNLQLKNYELVVEDNFRDYAEVDPRTNQVVLELTEVSDIVQEVSRICQVKQESAEPEIFGEKILVVYPADYRITFEEYERLKPFLSAVSIERKRVHAEVPAETHAEKGETE